MSWRHKTNAPVSFCMYMSPPAGPMNNPIMDAVAPRQGKLKKFNVDVNIDKH